MSVRLPCPTCRSELKVPGKFVGKQVRCGVCRQVFIADMILDVEPAEEPAVTVEHVATDPARTAPEPPGDQLRLAPDASAGVAGSASKAGLRIEYKLDLEDQAAFYIYYWNRYPPRRTWFVMFVFLVPIMFAFSTALLYLVLKAFFWYVWLTIAPRPQFEINDAWLVAGAGLLSVVVVTLAFRQWPREVRKSYEKSMSGMLKRAQAREPWSFDWNHRVVIDADGFILTSEIQVAKKEGVDVTEWKETKVKWTSVTVVDMIERHALIGSKAVWLILPKRFFKDEQAFLQFVETAKRYRQSAPSSQPSS